MSFCALSVFLCANTNAQEQSITQIGPRLIKLSETPGHAAWLTEDAIGRLSQKSHEAGHCGGFMDITEHQYKLNRRPSPVLPHPVVLAGPTLQHESAVRAMYEELSPQRIEALVSSLSSFSNRYYTSEQGVAAAHWIRDRFVEYSAGRSDIRVELVSHRFAQPSVVARIEGQGEHADEVVVIGGHEDSINQYQFWGEMHAPGADDNASGTAAVIEVFRVLAQSGFVPERSIEFMTYAGEERGLLGSQDIAERYRRSGKTVVGVMQLDMTMFPDETGAIYLITDHTNAALTDFAKRLLDTYVQHPWLTDRCGYACSDHASWTDAGYASVFPFEAKKDKMNRSIHTTGDLIERLSPDHGLPFAKLGVAFAVELAGRRL